MTHAEAIALPHASLLLAAHCGLDDGDINATGRAIYRLNRAEAIGQLCAAEITWLASLRAMYLSFIGQDGGRA